MLVNILPVDMRCKYWKTVYSKGVQLALSQDLWLLRVEKGMDTRIPSLEEARNTPLTVSDRSRIIENRKRMIIGTPEKVRDELLRLSEVYRTEEFMIINNLYNFEDKVNTYALLAEALI